MFATCVCKLMSMNRNFKLNAVMPFVLCAGILSALTAAASALGAPAEAVLVAKQGKLPAKGKEYPELGYKRLRDRPPKAQQQQQPAAAQ
ncbi:hypothetical protein QJQ45_008361 [Haematococcus lacustris]|nr:hypothetical protein QJQ45_008361 [Haematococcus lacustris]